jgi:hypothetical protein
MLRMQADGLITLPAPRNSNGNGRAYTRRTQATDPGLPIDQPVEQLTDLRLDIVTDRRTSHLWNEYIQRYHYLGYQPLPGAQLRYVAVSQGQVLALLGFGAAAWKLGPRDRWIGWNAEQRQERLHLVINNARFLILPWITSRNLASKLLALAARRVAEDWATRYGYRPVLMETFVETQAWHLFCWVPTSLTSRELVRFEHRSESLGLPGPGEMLRRRPDTPFVDDLYCPEIPNRRNSRLVATDQGELLPQLALEETARGDRWNR